MSSEATPAVEAAEEELPSWAGDLTTEGEEANPPALGTSRPFATFVIEAFRECIDGKLDWKADEGEGFELPDAILWECALWLFD